VRKYQRLPATVLRHGTTLDQLGIDEPGDELRDGRSGDSRSASELGAGDFLIGDGSQRQVLSHGQCRPGAGEKALDPTGREWRHRGKRVGGLGLGTVQRRHR
jgi:hypothetical protein